MHIEKYIYELLYEHDCVIIPQLGGFVTNYREAIIDVSRQEFSAPARIVSFNANLNQNDGLLINFIAGREKIEYKEIAEQVELFARQTMLAIKEGKKLEFDNLGYLWSEDGRIRFEPQLKQNFLQDSYGLGTFNYPLLKTHKKTKPLRPQVAVVEADSVSKADIENSNAYVYRRSWLIGIPAAAALIAVVVFSFTRDKAFERRIDQANFNPVQISEQSSKPTHEKTVDNSSEHSVVKTEDVNTKPISEVDTEEIVTETIPETVEDGVVSPEEEVVVIETPPEPIKAEINANNRYFVIAGSFNVKANAESLKVTLQNMGFEARVHDTGVGMYRVSVKAFSDMQSAINELQSLRNSSSNPDLWVLYI
jgi:hypothetical protein